MEGGISLLGYRLSLSTGHKKPRSYAGLFAIVGLAWTARDHPGRSARKVEKGDVEARVGIEPAYTALQAAA